MRRVFNYWKLEYRSIQSTDSTDHSTVYEYTVKIHMYSLILVIGSFPDSLTVQLLINQIVNQLYSHNKIIHTISSYVNFEANQLKSNFFLF